MLAVCLWGLCIHFNMDLIPTELRRAILLRLSLTQLRLLKAVSRGMASDCRAVLRSEAWQDVPLNWIALEAELKTQLHAYKLPLTVSIFSAFFPTEAPCIATVHRLKLARVNYDEVACDASPETWVPADDENTFTSITDMCIEVHGVGICGSETSLRIALQEEMRRRGTPKPEGFKVDMADALWPFRVELDEDGWSLCHGNEWANQVKLDRLLDRMEVATEVRKGVWKVHDPPHSDQNGFDYCQELSLLGLCRLGSKILL